MASYIKTDNLKNILKKVYYFNCLLDKITKDKYKGAIGYMITDIVWNVFKKTGDINMYLELRKIKDIEQNIKESLDETNKS